jgi:hypothetical protein
VKAVDTCALGTKAVVEETRQLAATTAIRDAMIETDFIVMDIVGRGICKSTRCQVTKWFVLAASTIRRDRGRFQRR